MKYLTILWTESGTPDPVAATDPLGGETAWVLTDDVASVYVLKDAIDTRVAAMLVGKAGGFAIVKLDTTDGTATTADVDGADYTTLLYHAYDADLVGTSDVAATGSATFWRPAVQLGATPTP
jgi:hypothetical protein